MMEDLRVLREQLECPGSVLASEQISEAVITYIRRLEDNTIELAGTRNSYATVAYQAQTAAIDLTRQVADQQAAIRRLEDELAAYRAALDSITQFVANRLKTAEQQRLNTFDFGDFGMSAQLATAATIYRDVQEAIDKALRETGT